MRCFVSTPAESGVLARPGHTDNLEKYPLPVSTKRGFSILAPLGDLRDCIK